MREGSPVKADRLARLADALALFGLCLDQRRDGPAVAERLERVLAMWPEWTSWRRQRDQAPTPSPSV